MPRMGLHGACFLLDAYDEYNVKFNYIYDLIFENALPLSLCVSTTRAFNEKVLKEVLSFLGFPLLTSVSIYVMSLMIRRSLHQ